VNRTKVPLFCAVVGVSFSMGCTYPTYCGFRQSELEESFVPLPAYVAHEPVACDHVVFMESVPTNRTFREVGLIAPRTAKQKSWGDAVHAALAAAALKGADATYPISEKEMETWGFAVGAYSAAGGKHHYVNLRMKAIVWNDVKPLGQ
jgi:hypothetical protein